MARHYVWSERVQAELKGGDDSEIAPAAPDRPEEVGVLGIRRVNEPTIGGDNVGADQIVCGQPELAAGPAEASAERKPGDAGRRIDAGRRDQPKCLRFTVELSQCDTRFDACGAGERIDAHRFHRRQIDHHPIIADGTAGDIVAAASNRKQRPRFAREIDCGAHVGCTGAPHDDGGPPVDHCVPDTACGAVTLVVFGQNRPANACFQSVQSLTRDYDRVARELCQIDTHVTLHRLVGAQSRRMVIGNKFTN